MKKDFIVRRSITMVDGKPHVETYSEQELVRCKNCRMGKMETNFYGEPCVVCHNSANGVAHVWHKTDWFCADGERRKDDA